MNVVCVLADLGQHLLLQEDSTSKSVFCDKPKILEINSKTLLMTTALNVKTRLREPAPREAAERRE